MFRIISETALSEHFIKLGGDITMDDLLKKPIKPIKVECTTLAMEKKDEHTPSAEGSFIRSGSDNGSGGPISQHDFLVKQKLVWEKFKQGEISREEYDQWKYPEISKRLKETADESARNRVDTVT